MKKLVLIGVVTLLTCGFLITEGPLSTVGARIQELYLGDDDPDMPAKFTKGGLSDEEFFAARTEYLMSKLGESPGEVYDPMIRQEAIREMTQQQAALQAQAETSIRSRQGRRLLLNQPQVATWTNVGPFPIPNGQTSGRVDPVSGRTTSIAVNPNNPDLVYAGTAQGGVYRSSNGGGTWTQLFNNADTQVIGALALAPSNPEILYVGTGEAGQCGSGCYGGIGVYRIDNASTTADLTGPINPVRSYTDASLNPVSAGVFSGRSISKILVNPTDPSIIFVSTASAIIGNVTAFPLGNTAPPLGLRGLYRLGGATGPAAGVTATKLTISGTNCLDSPCTGNISVLDMVFDGNDASGNTLVAWARPTVGTDGGIYRTTTALSTGTFTNTLSQTSTTNSRGELASVTIAGVTTMYLASGESSTGRVRKSTDGGLTWSAAALAGGAGYCGGQCFYDIAIAIDPTNANIAYLGGAAASSNNTTSIVRKTTDGFTSVGNSAATQTGLHADNHVIAVAPSNPSVVYDGSDGGIWRSTDAGANWVSLNNSSYSATQFQSLSVHPTDRWFTIGGTQDNGTNFLQPNAPALPSAGWKHADFGDGGYARIDQTATDTTNVLMYHTYFNQTNNLAGFGRVSNVSCANDGQWAFKGFGAGVFTNACGDVEAANGITGATDAMLFYAPLELGPVVAPATTQTVYFGTDRLYRSVNRGDTMTVVSSVVPAAIVAGVPISSIGISPTNDAIRVVGLNNGNVFATTTGSAVGAAMTNVTPPASPARPVEKVIVDPNNPFTVYVAYGGQAVAAGQHIWKTTNINAAVPTWTAAGSGIPDVVVNAVIVDPNNSNNLYAGTDIGVYASTDAGATWNPFGTGLPKIAVFEMAIQNTNRILRIATHGRGLWETSIAAPTAAGVSVSGRVLSPEGRGLRSARISITAPDGTSWTTATGPRGAYHFEDIPAGNTYVVAVASRRYSYEPRTLSLEDSVTGFDFIPGTARSRSR